MENNKYNNDDVLSKSVRAGRRTYFFDVKKTKADDYYLTITESKKFTNEDSTFYFKKHKIYLYKEDFTDFISALKETTDFILEEKGSEVISETHQKNYKEQHNSSDSDDHSSDDIKDLKFEDI